MTNQQPSSEKSSSTFQRNQSFDQSRQVNVGNLNGGLNIDLSPTVTIDRDFVPSIAHMQGRKDAIAEIGGKLTDPKIAIACIMGLGGYGKSTLAAKLFAEWQGGRFWADVGQRSRDFREFATRAIAQLAQVSLESLSSLPEVQLGDKLAAVLQGQHYLLVLDNLESLMDTDGNLENVLWREFLRNWANDGEGSKVLITTREEPSLPKLRLFRYGLREGLQEREGAAVLQDFGILGTDDELAAVSQRVGGIPLSLMFIVGLLRNDYEEEPHVCFLPKDLFGIVGAHRRGQVTTEDVFRSSFGRVVSRLQNLLMAVSVFTKPFDRKMAAAMVDEEVTDQDLLLLKRRGFVLGEPELSGLYRFQPQVQELVQRITDELPQLHRRAIHFYLTQCEIKPILDPLHDTLEDADPYLQVFHHYCELEEYESAFYTLRNESNKVDNFLTLRGYCAKRVDIYLCLVNGYQLDKLQQSEYRASLTSLGNAYYSLMQYQEAIIFHQQALEIARVSDYKQGEVNALVNLGNACHSLYLYNDAITFYLQSLEIARIINYKRGEASSLSNLGNAYHSLGQYQKAITFHQQALEIKQAICDKQGEVNSLSSLGNAYYFLKHYNKALFYHQQSLGISQTIDYKLGEAVSLGNLGNSYYSLSKYKEAITFQNFSLEISQIINYKQGVSKALGNLGLVYQSLKQYDKSIELHLSALVIAREIGDRQWESKTLVNLGHSYYSLGQKQEAILLYQQSVEINQAIGDKENEAASLIDIAHACNQMGRIKESFTSSYRATEIFQELKLPIEEVFYPKWFISIIRFAQRGKWQIVLCFCIGLFAFPLFLVCFVAILIWRWLRSFKTG
jgi:tetratricopeptide (TPR) repeat protein